MDKDCQIKQKHQFFLSVIKSLKCRKIIKEKTSGCTFFILSMRRKEQLYLLEFRIHKTLAVNKMQKIQVVIFNNKNYSETSKTNAKKRSQDVRVDKQMKYKNKTNKTIQK